MAHLDIGVAELVGQAIKMTADMGEKQDCEQNLIAFSEYVWPVVEPAIPMVQGWAMEAICEHLQAVADGQIRRLLINVPPGFSKSLLTDVFFPAWLWGPRNRPSMRFLCASYSEHLTVRDNLRCRSIIMSDRYKKHWGDRFAVSTDQFTKIKFANDKTGWKLATSVGGIGTGERADIVIVDDPNNPMEMESEAVRETTRMWFTEILPDRLNNLDKSAIVVIQQRTHEEDVSGIAIKREMGYEHLMIPMYYDPGRHCTTSSGWTDPRGEDGDLAWPERFSLQRCKEMERDKGPYAWTGQYQQIPEPRGGGIIKRDWWQMWKDQSAFPPLEYIIASVDTAYTEKEENDASALTVWGIFRDSWEETEIGTEALWMKRDGKTQVPRPIEGNPKMMLLWAWAEHLQFHELVEKVIETCVPHPGHVPSFKVDKLLIEGKASGLSVAQELHRLFRGSGKFSIDVINPTRQGDKVARAHSIVHLFADGMVWAPFDYDKDQGGYIARLYAQKVIDQCAMFPRGARDDLVDSVTMALRYLRDMGFALRREEHQAVLAAEYDYDGASARMPLYPVAG